MTKRNGEVLEFIKGFMRDHLRSPSYAEIGAGVGMRSPATVHHHIVSLARTGMIDRNWRAKRSIALRHRALEMDRTAGLQRALQDLLQVVQAGHGSTCDAPGCTFCAAVVRASQLVR